MTHALLSVLLAAALAAHAASAAASAEAGAPCSNPKVSAINQYCEIIPGATGGVVPGFGTPALAQRLPQWVIRRLRPTERGSASSRQRGFRARVTSQTRAALLALPAPTRGAALAPSSIVRSDSWSIISGLVIVLVAVTLGMAATAVALRRRHRTTDSRG